MFLGVPSVQSIFRGVPGVFRACSAMLRGFSRVFRVCSGGVPRVFWGVPGCSGSILPGFTDNPLEMRSAIFKEVSIKKLGF